MFGFSKSKQKKAFTIIELVVVIVIIAILSALSFLNYSSHLKEARNTTKIKDLTNIAEILDFYLLTGGELIEPDVASGSSLETGQKVDGIPDVFWKKGVFGENNFSKYGNISGKLKNPKTGERYTYYVSDNNKFYYLRVDLEGKPEKKEHTVTNYEKTRVVSTEDNLAFNPIPNPAPSQPGTLILRNCVAMKKEGYQVPAMNHNGTSPVTKMLNIPTNGTTTYSATANCDNGTVTITGESSNVTCNLNYHKEMDVCVANTRACDIINEGVQVGTGNQTWNTSTNSWNLCQATSCNDPDSTPVGNQCIYCHNPIYRDTNGITIKAKDCAEAGKEYDFEGNKYYLAKDIHDLNKRIRTLDMRDWYREDRIITSRVKSMNLLFASYDGRPSYSIESWDTSNVTNMRSMFFGSTNFNQDISVWDVSKVEDMRGMFQGATNFNQPLNNWNVKNVLYMSSMFFNAKNFNQPLNNWDVSNVLYMDSMFHSTKKFDQPLNNWNVKKVRSMNSMFFGTNFRQDISNWNVTGNCIYMFRNNTVIPINYKPSKCR